MKRIKLSVWSIMVLCLSLALVSCGDDDHKNDHHGMRTGIHKIVVEQSGNTEDFEVNLVFGATNVNGPARLYDENGDYLGDSYSVGKMKSNRVSCQTGQDGFFMTCSGSATSTSEESGKRLKVTIIAYVNGAETNRLVKGYTTQGEILMENFSLSTTSVE